MTSKLVMDRLQTAGLAQVLALREQGVQPDAALAARIAEADTLLVGAAADIARRRELGDEATIFVPCAPAGDLRLTVLRPLPGEGGTLFLRRLSALRLTGPLGLQIIVDWTEIGLTTAQLGLSFGASGLAGPIAGRRGLPIAEVDAQRTLVKRRELTAYVERAGYRARFVNTPMAAASDLVGNQSSTPDRGDAHVGS